MIYQWDFGIPDFDEAKPRRAWLYLPTSYEHEDQRGFPVLYMFDGQNLFFDEEASYGRSWRIGEYLDYTDTPVIVAAIDSNQAPDNSRLSEYSPFDFCDPEFGKVQGRGDSTLKWLVHEFKPFVDSHLNTRPQRESTFIAGSSMGGLMSIYALFRYNEVFSRAAALSPALSFMPRELAKFMRETSIDTDSVLFMDMGTREIGGRKRILRDYTDYTALLMKRGIRVTSRIVPGGIHSEETWDTELPFMFHTLMYGI